MRSGSGGIVELPPYRGVLVVDAKEFGGNTDPDQAVLAAEIPDVVAAAFERAGLAQVWQAALFPHNTGDGFGIGFDTRYLPAVVSRLFDSLQAGLAERHVSLRDRARRTRLRMRASLNIGPVRELNSDISAAAVGRAVITTHRLLDSPAVRDVLTRSDPDHTFLAAVMSQRVYDDVVAAGYAAIPESRFVPRRVEVKEFTGLVYLYIPQPSGDLLRYGVAGHGERSLVAGQGRSPESGSGSTTTVVSGSSGGSAVGSVVQIGLINQVGSTHRLGGLGWLPVPRQLPAGVRDFIGQNDQLAELDALLSRDGDAGVGAPVAVVHGLPGVGKTSLVVQWAHRIQHRFPNGTLFVNLRGYGPCAPLDPEVVLSSFLLALGVPQDAIPATLDAQTGVYRSLLADRRILIVLDNAASADQVRPLLPGACGCAVVVTSRARLTGLAVTDASGWVSLDVLGESDAVDLVEGILGADRSRMERDGVIKLVRACGRLPLALRVAATQIAAREKVTIAELVGDITSGSGADGCAVPGDASSAVETVFGWSQVRLPANLACLYRRLGLHPGPEFGVQAAAALMDTDVPTAYRGLETLVELRLLEPRGHKRYQLHDLLYADARRRAERDEDAEHRSQALRHLLTWYAQAATVADGLLFPAHPQFAVDLGPMRWEPPATDRQHALPWLITEQMTLLAAGRCATERGWHRIAVGLAAAMRFLAWRPRVWWRVRLEAESIGLTSAQAVGDGSMVARLLNRRADTFQMLGQWRESDADLNKAASLTADCLDRGIYGETLCGLGRSRKLQHRYEEALTYYSQAWRLAQTAESVFLKAVVECNLSQLNASLGCYPEAIMHAECELALYRAGGDPVGEAYAWHDLAMARQGAGNHRAAIQDGERAIAIYRQHVATESYLAVALETVARSQTCVGDRFGAAQHLDEAATILTKTGDPRASELHDWAYNLRPPIVKA